MQSTPIRASAEWPGRITGLYWTEDHAEAIHGTVAQGTFHPGRWATAATRDGGDLAGTLRRLFHAGRIPSERLSTSVPASLLSTRYFTLPSQDDAELEAMVRHQLSIALPVDLDGVTWTFAPIDAHDDGSSSVVVHIMRRDQLDSHLRAVREISPNVWSAIPEGQLVARLAAQGLGPSGTRRTVLTWRGDTFHLLVESRGTPVYHRTFPGAGADGESRAVSGMLLRAIGELQGARSEYQRTTRDEFPLPVHVLPTLGLGASESEDKLAADFATRLQEQTGLDVVTVPADARTEPIDTDSSSTSAPLAHSLAELGASSGPCLLPPEDSRRLATRAGRRALLSTFGILAGIVLLVGLSLFGDLGRREARLDQLRAHVAAERSRVAELEVMRAELEASVAQGDAFDLLRVLGSLERALDPTIRIRSLSYDRSGLVRFQGTAPDLGHLTDLRDRLEASPPWEDVTILRMLQPDQGELTSYDFDVEGRLRP